MFNTQMFDRLLKVWQDLEQRLPGFRFVTAVFLILIVLGYLVVNYVGAAYWWIVVPGFFVVLLFVLFLWLILTIINGPKGDGVDRWMRTFLMRFLFFLFIGFVLTAITLSATLAIWQAPAAIYQEVTGTPPPPLPIPPSQHDTAFADRIMTSPFVTASDRQNRAIFQDSAAMAEFVSRNACPYCAAHGYAGDCVPDFTKQVCDVYARIHDSVRNVSLESLPHIVRSEAFTPQKAPDSGSCASRTLFRAGTPARILGIDLYHGDKTVDWDALAAKGVYFVYLKATQGTTFIDPAFIQRWNAAGRAGLIRGAYHVYTDADPGQQAALFLGVMAQVQVGPCDVGAALDLGSYAPASPTPALQQTFVGNALVWLSTVRQATNKSPAVFLSNNAFAERLGAPAALGGYPLWIASYNPLGEPPLPSAWTKYRYWQFTDGKNGDVSLGLPYDVNVFNGTPDELFGLTR